MVSLLLWFILVLMTIEIHLNFLISIDYSLCLMVEENFVLFSKYFAFATSRVLKIM